MELSYSQNLEDYHLSLAFAGQKTGTYIDVGAGHPIADNVSFWFYERGWQGIVVEPQLELAALYERLRRRDIVVRGLVGRECGEIDFHVVDRLHGLSTTREDVAQKAEAFGVRHRTVRAPVTTLAQLCESHDRGSIDFLKIDVEGAEADVLLGGDWKRFRPKVVIVEAVTPMESEPSWHTWEPFLVAQGYRFVLFDTLNRFYVAQEHPEILARLPTERAPWHAVRHITRSVAPRRIRSIQITRWLATLRADLGEPALSRHESDYVDPRSCPPYHKSRRCRSTCIDCRQRTIPSGVGTHCVRLRWRTDRRRVTVFDGIHSNQSFRAR